MISSLAWVPAGVADPSPKKYEMNATEKELIKLMEEKGSIEEVEAQLMAQAQESTGKSKIKLPPALNDLPADLRMDDYSSDEEEEAQVTLGNLLVGNDQEIDDNMVPEEEEEEEVDDEEGADDRTDAALNDRNTISDDDSDDDLADVPDTREFTQIDLEGMEAMGLSQIGKNSAMTMDDLGGLEDDDSEAEDVKLTADDALLCVAKTEDDFASLEVHVYDQRQGNLYVHHDIPLPAFPLCLAHGRVASGGRTGNFCAVGTFNTGIEVWNLDVLNALEPSCVLGGEDTSNVDEIMRSQLLSGGSDRMPARPGRGGLRKGSHSDAVMALSWNEIHRQVIASGSADCTVKLWDVTKAGTSDQDECNAGTFTHHKDKVASVVWHPTEGTLLATASYDRRMSLIDARGSSSDAKFVKIAADPETIAWDPTHPEYLTIATEDGTVACWDVRKFETSTPLWSFVANQYGVNDLSYNPSVPGMFATASTDKQITIWDAYPKNNAPTENIYPKSCGSRDMCGGKLYTCAFYPSSKWLIGCGGSGNQLSLWDLSSETSVQKPFAARLRDQTQTPELADASGDDLKAMMTEKETEEKPASIGKTKKRRKKAKKVHKKGK